MLKLDEVCLDAFTSEDVSEFRTLAKNVTAVFIYNKNVLTGGKECQIDSDNFKVRTEMRCGVSVAPVSVFECVDGGRVEKSAISVGKKTLSFKKNSKKYTVSGKTGVFSVAPFSYLGHTYVPVAECALALGLSTLLLYGDRLTVFGSKSDISAIKAAIKKNPALEFAGGRAVIGEYDATKFTSADYKAAKDKWRESLVASPELIDTSDALLMEKIKARNDSAAELWRTLNRGEDRIILWGDEAPTESCHLRFQYDKLFALTLAWGTFGGELYHNEDLKRDILDAYRWMYENMYGEAEIENRGWRSIHTFNWWDWYVGAIEPMTDGMLIMEEFFTYEEKKKYLKVLEFVLDSWRTGNSQDHCSGRMSVGTKCALLLEDSVRLERSSNDYHVMLEVKLAGPGTHTDYCNYQHGFPYNMMYGMSNINRVLKVGANLAGTPLEFASPRYYNQFNLFKFMYEAAMYRGRGFMCYWGRASSGSERNAGMGVITKILPMIGNYGPEEDEYIRHFVKYSLSSEEQIAVAKRLCSLGSYAAFKDILEDDTISSSNDYECAHAWFTADRATQHKNDYAFCVSMPSYRHPNYECINNANKTGWYMNDGTLYLYTKTDQFEFDGVNFVLNNRLAHRMPGTTVDVRERKAVAIAGGSSWYPKSDIVGCMQFDGKYVVAGMDYEAYNQAEDEIKEDKGYGGGKPKFENDLVAKKAYFMFDDECVCLGTGITSTMNSDINTVVEHRRLVKLEGEPFGKDRIVVDGELLTEKTFDKSFDKPKWAMIEDFAGYVFTDAKSVSVSKYMYEHDPAMFDGYVSFPEWAKGNRPFAEMMINHGKNPKADTYAYAILPYANEEKTAAYAKNPDYKIISNTPACQAVKEKTLGVTAIIFYEAGECAGIKVDRPCIVTYSEKRGKFKISVAEPTNKTDKVKLEIMKKLTPVSADARYKIKCDDTVKITLNVDLSAGEGYEAVFSKT